MNSEIRVRGKKNLKVNEKLSNRNRENANRHRKCRRAPWSQDQNERCEIETKELQRQMKLVLRENR